MHTAEIGFVGLGVMGSRIAKRLINAGHHVTGYNRTQAKAQELLDAGMKWGDCPRQVVEASQFIFSMVTNTRALLAITEGPDGILEGLAPGKIHIDMSTVSPAASRAQAEKVAARGAQMLDAPVSGSVTTVEEGKLSIMVGGDRAAFEKVKPVLLDIGPKVTYVGENGLAVTMKIAVNLSLAVQMLAFSEGVLLAEKSGIPRETAVEVMLNSVIASPMLKYRGPLVLDTSSTAPVYFDVDMAQKDSLLALELGRQLNVPLPTAAVTNEFLTAARALGMADKDFAVLFNTLAILSGEKA